MTPRLACTVGYQGADRAALITALAANGVDLVVDTRNTPTSRRPEYRRRTLESALTAAGIGYVSVPQLGVPMADRKEARTDWKAFAARYVGRQGQDTQALAAVVALSVTATIVLLCFEAEEGQCHRLLLSELLAARSLLRFEHFGWGG